MALASPHRTLDILVQGRDLAEAEAAALLTLLTTPDVAPAMAGALLKLQVLRTKGVTAAEVRGFASAMRSLARKPALPEALDAIDIVGTGGDASGSLNLSTGAALLAAACGLARGQAWQSVHFQPQRQRRFDRAAGLYAAIGRDPGGALLCGHRFHVLVRAVFSSRDEGPGAHPRRTRHSHGIQFAGAVDQSRRAALSLDRRLRCATTAGG